ncbi:hypothetical protein I4F81_006555 [Pyropia yezoensis]|uniref:Uncharacterized protein n=1 Tax=Pyropia yezoensis TaxID=2788 RepID=A0ACC3C106_PYRYE|nr:hypothetical protein I4F81_006555 [Neopyropia yezoensis]
MDQGVTLLAPTPPSAATPPAATPTAAAATASPPAAATLPPIHLPSYLAFADAHGLDADSASAVALYQVYCDLRLVRGWTDVAVATAAHPAARAYLVGTSPQRVVAVEAADTAAAAAGTAAAAAAAAADAVRPPPPPAGGAAAAIPREAVVSMPLDAVTSAAGLHALFDAIRIHPGEPGYPADGGDGGDGGGGVPYEWLTLALVDSDTTTAYYRLFGEMAVATHTRYAKRSKRERAAEETAAAAAGAAGGLEDEEMGGGGEGGGTDSD